MTEHQKTLIAALHGLVDVEERLNRYRRTVEPDVVNLSTAENVLLFDFYQTNLFSKTPPLTVNDLRYPGSIYGGELFQQSWARFFNLAWGEELIAPEDVYAVGGTSAALECLAFILGEPGQSVLSPAPLWYGFPWCFTQGPKLNFVPFNLTEEPFDSFVLTLADVQRAYASGESVPKFLVLTNPNNPLGGNYPKETLEAIYDWVLTKTDMHIISDEIYFRSQVGDVNPFVPAFALDAVKRAGDAGRQRVHAVWGLAKDFGMSGFKVGFVISRNDQVKTAMTGSKTAKSLAWFTPFDSLKQHSLRGLFFDDLGLPDPALAQAAMEAYADGPDALLKTQYETTRQTLEDGGIKYHPGSEAGIFFWLDLREFLDKLPSDTGPADGLHAALHPGIDDRESRLSAYIVKNSGVSLVPGQECFCRDPGFFRLCYTAEPLDRVVDGLKRMAGALHELEPNTAMV